MADQPIPTLEALADALDRVENRIDLESVVRSWCAQTSQPSRRIGFELIYDVHRALARKGDE